MHEATLRDVLFVRAFEEGDESGELIGLKEREIATREVRAELARVGQEIEPEVFLERRAERLRQRIERAFPNVSRVLAISARRGPPAWLVFLGAFGIGVGIDRLGSARTINLLSFPILGLLVWNIAIYLLLFVSDLLRTEDPPGHEGRSSRAAATGLGARTILWLNSPDRFWRKERSGHELEGKLAVNVQRYLRDWSRVGAPLHLARGATWMHLGACGLMLGAIAGLYLRGLVWQYEVSWESTFLTPGAVHSIVATVFAPAAWVTGQAIPDVGEIIKMQGPESVSDAARWIHYYGVTGLAFVIVPRLILAAFSRRRSAALSRAVPFRFERDGYFMRLLAVDSGAGRSAFVQAYSYHPNQRAREGLTTLLLDVLGARTQVETLEVAAYGADAVSLPSDQESSELCLVALFSLAQSPESEVHGAYLRQLQNGVRRAQGRSGLLVVIDASPLAERLGSGEDGRSRLDERERAWRRFLDEFDALGVFCTLDGFDDSAVLEEARDAIWRGESRGVGA